MKKQAVVVLLATVLLVSGCASHRLELTGSIDSSNKTVSAPAGSLAILGPVKRKLVINGWKVDEFDKMETRYKLTINTVRTQLLCWNEWSEVAYEIMFLDKKAQTEVFRMTGESCDSYTDVGDAFENALKAAEFQIKKQ